MNRDQMKGTAKDIAGKIQRKFGEATGNENPADQGRREASRRQDPEGRRQRRRGARQGGQAKQRRPGQEDALDQAWIAGATFANSYANAAPAFYRDLRAPSRFLCLR